MKLRVYQRRALSSLFCALKHCRRVLLSLPTGAGKTIMMAQWALEMAKKGYHTAIVVDRVELVQQTLAVLDNKASVLKSGYQFDSSNLIQIIMLQTANRRMEALLDLQLDYVFFDEIHNYFNGKIFQALCDCQPRAKIIGVSATPIDDKGYLLAGFTECINDIQTQQLIDEGYLVTPIYYTPKEYNLNLSCIRMTNGDYDLTELDNLMANVGQAEKIYREWYKIASDRKTIVFCSSIKQAEILCQYFSQQGVNARTIHSETYYTDRENILYNFHIGIVRVIFNVGILIAGYDEPTVDCIVFANPTKILRRYLQQAGRGLRLADGKKDCLMLDCANIVREHGFCNDLRFYRRKLKDSERCTIKQCPECGAIVSKTVKVCPYCGYDFAATPEEVKPMRKKDIEKLERAFDMQQQLKQIISELVDKCRYKSGYKWYLFLDCLKTKRPTESSLQFFKRKLTKIKKIRQRGYKLAALKYD